MKIKEISASKTEKKQGQLRFESVQHTFSATAELENGEDKNKAAEELKTWVKQMLSK